jgi:hypothetical protein
LVSWNIKSAGKWLRFRFTLVLKREFQRHKARPDPHPA